MPTHVIAIDGPSYVGKSSISQCLSDLTGCAYVNTGHMYRAIAQKAMERKVASDDTRLLARIAQNTKFEFTKAGGSYRTIVDGRDLTNSLDLPEIVSFASRIALIPDVRHQFLNLQRALASEQTIIMEGRDIGSSVFPEALWKFYVTASVRVRAKRMLKMMSEDERKAVLDYRHLIPKIKELDERDENRLLAPLKVAPDAIVYDNSDSPSEQQDAVILYYYITHTSELIRNARTISGKTSSECKDATISHPHAEMKGLKGALTRSAGRRRLKRATAVSTRPAIGTL